MRIISINVKRRFLIVALYMCRPARRHSRWQVQDVLHGEIIGKEKRSTLWPARVDLVFCKVWTKMLFDHKSLSVTKEF